MPKCGPGCIIKRTEHLTEKNMKIKVEQHTFSGAMWIVGWLFTIGFLHLTFWRGVLAIIIWPYYIGTMISSLIHR